MDVSMRTPQSHTNGNNEGKKVRYETQDTFTRKSGFQTRMIHTWYHLHVEQNNCRSEQHRAVSLRPNEKKVGMSGSITDVRQCAGIIPTFLPILPRSQILSTYVGSEPDLSSHYTKQGNKEVIADSALTTSMVPDPYPLFKLPLTLSDIPPPSRPPP